MDGRDSKVFRWKKDLPEKLHDIIGNVEEW